MHSVIIFLRRQPCRVWGGTATHVAPSRCFCGYARRAVVAIFLRRFGRRSDVVVSWGFGGIYLCYANLGPRPSLAEGSGWMLARRVRFGATRRVSLGRSQVPAVGEKRIVLGANAKPPAWRVI